MPEKQPIPLYIAKSVAQLQEKAELPKSSKPTLIVKIASKVYSEALNSYKNGDEEKAYIMFYKYFQVFQFIKKSKEYQKDKTYFDSMMSPKDVKISMSNLEELSESLVKRYEIIAQEERIKKEIKMENNKPKSKVHQEQNGDSENHKNEDDDEKVIEASQLYSLIKEKSTSFLLLGNILKFKRNSNIK